MTTFALIMAFTAGAWGTAAPPAKETFASTQPDRIKAFCIDFNWVADGFAPPGTFAHASPREHIQWYRDLGANTIQTFCLNCCGYAWYRSKIAPVQPGMKGDFLKEITQLGHEAGFRVMGYFCVASNTWWGQQHPDLSYGTPSWMHIPLTNSYLDYLCAVIGEAVTHTGIDGFMIDWMYNLNPKKMLDIRWLDCEKEMFEELFGRTFPGADAVDDETIIEFHRRAVDRAWTRIHQAAKNANPDCIIWLSCNDLANPQVAGSKMFREIDWLMNEDPDPARLNDVRAMVGPHTKIIQCLCGWGDKHDPRKVLGDPRYADVGYYGFARADEKTTLPPMTSDDPRLAANARNIEILRAMYGGRQPPATQPGTAMRFMFHADPRFLEGLRRHGLLRDGDGLRLHNTGLDPSPFGPRWAGNRLLDDARRSGRFYYIDRITGGMPFQSLHGIKAIADELKDDPNFMGFQVHEWGNSVIRDYERVCERIIEQGKPFDHEHFAPFEGRTDTPFFSSGDFDTYEDLFGHPIESPDDVRRLLEGFMAKMVERTAGKVMAVNGYVQLYDLALRLGAANIMAEIGNQVPLTALQIACARGAARRYGKLFGVYYEPWGGRPFGGPCALGWSPWFPDGQNPDGKLADYRIRPELGSSRSLQRRLLYYSWLAGADYVAEEWGAENYFADWQDYQLTDYGRVVKDFRDATAAWGRVDPIVPAALVMPHDAIGVDIRYLNALRGHLTGRVGRVHTLLDPDPFHLRLKLFTDRVLASRPRRSDADDFNLTPSPWIGAFDVLPADMPQALRAPYQLLIYFDPDQLEKAPQQPSQLRLCIQTDDDVERCIEALESLFAFRIEGEVGAAHARCDGRYLIGLFNNLGVSKTDKGESAAPSAAREAIVRGPLAGAIGVVGGHYITAREDGLIHLKLPAGELAVLSLPDLPGN